MGDRVAAEKMEALSLVRRIISLKRGRSTNRPSFILDPVQWMDVGGRETEKAWGLVARRAR